MFAILGLRALYFVLAGYLGGLKYLKPALAAILVFVGIKMLLVDTLKIPPLLLSLAVILSILVAATVGSILRNESRPVVARRSPKRLSVTNPSAAGPPSTADRAVARVGRLVALIAVAALVRRSGAHLPRCRCWCAGELRCSANWPAATHPAAP